MNMDDILNNSSNKIPKFPKQREYYPAWKLRMVLFFKSNGLYEVVESPINTLLSTYNNNTSNKNSSTKDSESSSSSSSSSRTSASNNNNNSSNNNNNNNNNIN